MSNATSVLFGFGLEAEFQVVEIDRVGAGDVRVVTEMVAREAACPACGVFTSRVKDRPLVAVKDLDASGQRIDLWWCKRRLVCLEYECPKGTFTQTSTEVPPRARLTNPLRAWIATAI